MWKWNDQSSHGTKKKEKKENMWVPDRIQTYDLPNTWLALYPLSYGQLTESEAIY